MLYPEWSPEALIKHHKHRCDISSKGEFSPDFNPSDYVESMRTDEKFKTFNENQFKEIEESLYRSMNILPRSESDELLLRLITDQRMKDVWLSLSRRKRSDEDEVKFWLTCEMAIAGWRGEPKITNKERKQILFNIHNYSEMLSEEIRKIRDFDSYNIVNLLKDDAVESIMEIFSSNLTLESKEDKISYSRFHLSYVMPKLQTILINLMLISAQSLRNDVVVKKPNSENAEVHYFVRQLSNFFRNYFGQPLHDSVAITASVLLDVENIDSDYVRKLVSIKPAS